MLANVPAGFTETPIVTGLTSPVTMDIDDSGRIFLAFQNGTIRVIENDQMLATPFTVLDADGSGERGLQGIELDPDYENNGFIYVYYTAASPSSHNRVSRLTVDPTTENTMVPGSEVVLLDLPNLSTVGNPIWHMGGAIHVAADGTLLVQVGDHQDTSKPQNLDHPFGKILRINRDGTIPTDNPWYDAGNGISWRDYLWAAGVRNPFSGDVNPSTGQYFFNDVGAGSWEEINDNTAGGLNFGWPTTEGNFNAATYPQFTQPFHAYSHGEDCAITGGAFYQPDVLQFPVEYHGKYFYSQFCRSRIMVIDPANPSDNQIFATDAEFPMNIEVGPDGSMYYVARGAGAGGNPGTGTGKVLKIENDIQIPPTIIAQPADTLGSVGHGASFFVGAAGSFPLNYQWQSRVGADPFADIPGATEATLVLNDLSLADDGREVRAVVTNASGSATSAAATLDVTTDQPPVVSIDTPLAGTTYVGGQEFTFSGSAVDNEDGVLDGNAMTWQIDFHHDDHLHPFYPETTGIDSDTFAIPFTGETSPNVWYRIRLTVTDSAGLTTTVFRDIDPQLATFTVTSNLDDGAVLLDGSPSPSFNQVTGVVGIERSLQAAPSVREGLTTYPFLEWLDGSSDRLRTETVGTGHTTYAALYADPSAAQDFISDLPVTNYTGQDVFAPFRRDTSFGRNPLRLEDVEYHRGMGVRSGSDMVFDLDGEYTAFRADVGIADEVGAAGSVVFKVFVDGGLAYESPTMIGLSSTQSVDVDITGAQTLRLVVEDAGDGSQSDWGNWANARLVRSASDDRLRINFQLAGADTPADYFADTGELFGDRGNGLTYGWSSDHTDVSRDRNTNGNQLLDTLVHFHDGQTWEVEVPNGLYAVTVAIGDAGFPTSHTLLAEGAPFWNLEATAANEFRHQSQVVHVTDGRLTLGVDNAADKATRINYIEIDGTPFEGQPQAYRDADINLDGVLDGADTAAFAAAWRTDTTGMSVLDRVQAGDFNFDDQTNFEDFQILRDADARVNPEPEPAVDPAVADAARSTLLAGVSEIGIVGAPGQIAVFDPPNAGNGEGAFSIMHDGDYRPIAAAAIWGSGKIVGMGHNGYTNFANVGDTLDTGQFYRNSLEWLSGTTDLSINIVTASTGTRDWLIGQGYTNVTRRTDWENALGTADVLIAELGTSVSAAKQQAVSSFIQSGGGLITGGTGWGYQSLGHDLKTMDGNVVLRQAGLAWADGFRNGTTVATARSEQVGNASEALAFAENYWLTGQGTTAFQQEAGTALKAVQSVLPDDHPLMLQLNQSFGDRSLNVSATPASPVSNVLDQAVLTWESNLLREVPPQQVVPHETAEALYGAVPADASRTTDTIVLDTSQSRWHATGYYAAPGEVVTLTFPPQLVGQGYQVHVSAHRDDISQRSSWERMPVVHRAFEIDQTTISVASAFGGLLFVDLGSTPPTIGDAAVQLQNVVPAPYFVLGEHTDAEWNSGLRERPAPFGVFVSDGLIISMPKHQIESADLTQPEALMGWWDTAVQLQDDLAAQTAFRTSPELINVDVQISAGAAHAGYPIQAYERFWGNLADFDQLTEQGSWGDFHELGHNHQRGWWTFDGDVEVSVNIFSNYALESLAEAPTGGWSFSVDPVATLQEAVSNVSQGGTYSSKSNRWAFWFQLADGFGWETYQTVFAGYEADASRNPSALPTNNQAEKDQWLVRWSNAVGFNMESFMVDTWGLSVTPSAINEVSHLPDWMPLATRVGDFQVNAGGTHVFNPTSAGLGMDGVATFVGVVSNPTNGTLIANGDGTFSYQPSVQGGEDAFVLRYQSSAGNTQDFTIDVTIGNGYLAGDVNLDGSLNLADIDRFIDGWRTDTSGMADEDRIRSGDLNLDGVTDFADWQVMRDAWEAANQRLPWHRAWQLANRFRVSPALNGQTSRSPDGPRTLSTDLAFAEDLDDDDAAPTRRRFA